MQKSTSRSAFFQRKKMIFLSEFKAQDKDVLVMEDPRGTPIPKE